MHPPALVAPLHSALQRCPSRHKSAHNSTLTDLIQSLPSAPHVRMVLLAAQEYHRRPPDDSGRWSDGKRGAPYSLVLRSRSTASRPLATSSRIICPLSTPSMRV